MHLPRFFRGLITVWLFAQLFISWVVLWMLQELAIAVMYPFTSKEARQDVCGWIHRTMNMLAVQWLNPLWWPKVLKPFPKLPKNVKLIVMSNHLSNADGWLVNTPIWPRDCKWVCKGSLFNIPFGGWGLRNAGDLEVKFTKEKGGWGTVKGSVAELMAQARCLLDRRAPIVVFPEGVRNPNPLGPLGEFKKGFFDLAVQEGATIVPIVLSGSERAWPLGDWKFDAARIYITCCDPINAAGLTTDELKKQVWETMTAVRDSHPDHDRQTVKLL